MTLVLQANGKITCAPDPFHVSKAKRDDKMVLWQRKPPGPFSVHFKGANGSPFAWTNFDQDNPCSGLVRRDVEPGTVCRYSVTIDGHTLDPGGRVDP